MPITRQEVESILNVQREVLQTSRELRLVSQHQPQQQAGQQANQIGSQEASNQQLTLLQQILSEIRENMNVVRREFGGIVARLGTQGQPSPLASAQQLCSNCASSTLIIVLLGLHLVTLLGFIYYQNSAGREQVKKFY